MSVPGPPPLLSRPSSKRGFGQQGFVKPQEEKNVEPSPLTSPELARQLSSRLNEMKADMDGGDTSSAFEGKTKRMQSYGEVTQEALEGLDTDLKVFKEGYVMKRCGMGPDALKHWEVRFLSLAEKHTKKGLLIYLVTYTSHVKDQKKDSTLLTPGMATVFPIERDAYDEGRRSCLLGFRTTGAGSPNLVIDTESNEVMQDWMGTAEGLGFEITAQHHGPRMDGNSLKEGWLVKRGGALKTWKRRYFVLLPQMIAYYKTKGAKRAQGFIPLNKNMVVAQHDRGEAYFSVSNPPPPGVEISASNPMGYGREYVMRAYNGQHSEEWLAAIKKSVEALQDK